MAVEVNKHIGFFAEALLRPQLGHIGSGALPAQRPIVFDFALRKKLDLETFTRASGAMYWDGPAGKLASVGNNVPVREWSARGIFKGRRIEEPRTNLLLWSEKFDNPSWLVIRNTGAAIVTPNTDIAPDGTQTAYTLTDDDTGLVSAEGLQASVTVAADTTVYCGSVFVKKDGVTSRFPALHVVAGAKRYHLALNTKTGEVRSYKDAATAFGVQDCGDYWRIYIAGPNDGVGTLVQLEIYPAALTDFNGTDGAAATGSIVAWGAQLEAGSFPTSYIKTEGSTATRAADVCTIDDISGFFNAAEGTILVECLAEHTETNRVALSVDDGTSSERMELRWSGTFDSVARCEVVDGGVSQVTIQPNASGAKVRRLALAYKANDFAAVVNGGTVSTDTSGTLPTVDRFLIGDATFAGGTLNGWVRRILYWPKRLPNQQLQLLSKAA